MNNMCTNAGMKYLIGRSVLLLGKDSETKSNAIQLIKNELIKKGFKVGYIDANKQSATNGYYHSELITSYAASNDYLIIGGAYRFFNRIKNRTKDGIISFPDIINLIRYAKPNMRFIFSIDSFENLSESDTNKIYDLFDFRLLFPGVHLLCKHKNSLYCRDESEALLIMKDKLLRVLAFNRTNDENYTITARTINKLSSNIKIS